MYNKKELMKPTEEIIIKFKQEIRKELEEEIKFTFKLMPIIKY